MTRKKRRGLTFTNYLVLDEVGRRYRVTLTNTEPRRPLFVGRKCLPHGREQALDPYRRKGATLVEKAMRGECERILSLKERTDGLR